MLFRVIKADYCSYYSLGAV